MRLDLFLGHVKAWPGQARRECGEAWAARSEGVPEGWGTKGKKCVEKMQKGKCLIDTIGSV